MLNDDELSALIHGLRNPLNNISLYAELARLKLQDQQDIFAAAQALEKIIAECQRCGELLAEVHPGTSGNQ